MIDNQALLSVPRSGGNPPLALDMTEIYRIESRISEISLANPMSMPSLIADFNLGYIKTARMIAAVQLEKSRAEMAMQEAKSVALLEKVEALLAEKKIKSTADTREAALTLDPDYKRAVDTFNILEATLRLLIDKAKAFEMAYHGSKKVSEVQARIPDSRNFGGYNE